MQGNFIPRAMDAIVPITRFNKGEASKIFEEVKNSGDKLVLKNNIPACVLVEPERYYVLMEMLSDFILQEEAQGRMAHYNAEDSLTHEQMMKELGITQEDLDDLDVEIE